MARRKIIESEKYVPEDLDVKNWPIVLTDNLSDKDKATYLKRKKAVEMYLGNQPIKEIRYETGIDFESLRRLVLRCIDNRDENGVILGFRALIPNKRLKATQENRKRTTLTQGGSPNFLIHFPNLLN
ncbi:hypothetical protein GZH47_32510 (plasmid) [Paenibacillus rhizovicinus]|uniref:Uncharacterized protein n=1 Tax=Paenibacillus rhizovicinus TaxID=2704463 RepID=A0A6C0PAZ2_9BACL|nr:hypothetical protein [Paenibacillus rhizovicinus]QHW35606.1 hypothetical protein GZH47_32510 [Paenibacillus rhizovicinus]